jgi:Pyruvate/2-oxoacid:ferredoxin oxidoreductase gamma subunit
MGGAGRFVGPPDRALAVIIREGVVGIARERTGEVAEVVRAGLTGIVHLDSVAAAIREAFPGKVGERNVAAATAAHHAVAAMPAAA